MSLSIQNVSYGVGGRQLLNNISLELRPGKMIGLIGPNGAGKSTALKLMSGELKPKSGRVTLNNQDLTTFTPQSLALARSVMAQSASVVFDFSVTEILEMGWVQGSVIAARDRDRAIAEVVEACDIGGFLERKFNSLSGGEQQRVQFARNLLQLWRPDASDERFFLLDEPTASMDIRYELSLLKQLRAAVQQNIGVLIVLHDLNLAARFMDEVVLMQSGAVVAAGVPKDVLREAILSDVYQTDIRVEENPQFDRLVIHT